MLTQSEIHQIADIIWERLLANQRPYLRSSSSKKGHTFILEIDAAAMLGYHPRTIRQRVLGKGKYEHKEHLPITITAAGKSYRYSLEDIEKYLQRMSSR